MDYPDYKPYEEGSAFQPVSVPDTATTLAREYDRQNKSDQRNLKFVEQNNARRVEEAKKQGQNLQTLAKFSKTLTDQFVKQYKQNEDDKFTNEVYDDILNGVPEDVALAETEEISAVSAEANTINTLATSVEEETGDIAASQLIRDELAPNAEAQVASRSDLLSAQAAYPSYMQAWMTSDTKITIGGQEMTVAQAIATGDPRLIQSAIALGRNQFIKENNIRGARRTDVVRFLGRTMLATDAKQGAEAARQAVAADRKQRIEDLTGTTYNLAGQFNSTNSQEMWSALADQYWESGLFPTRAASNEAVLTDIISRLTDDGNVEALESLKGTLKTGEKGTELENQYGNQINDAIKQAEAAREGRQIQQVKDIKAGMYAELNGVEGADARASIVEKYAKQLEEAGRYQEARELRRDQAALSVEGNSARNAQILSDQIRLGEVTEDRIIDEAYERGEITQESRDTLKAQLETINDAKTPTNPQAQARASEYTARFASDALPLFGLQRDANGNVIDPVSGQVTVISRGEYEIIEGAITADLNRAMSAVLKANPNLDGTQLDIELRKAANEWYQTNVLTKGGKYYIGDLQDAFDTPSNIDDDKAARAAATKRFGTLINDPVAISRTMGLPTAYRPRDLSLTMITPATAVQFNPIRGDKLFQKEAMERYREQYEETGEIAPYIQNVAELVGMTPLALFQQQLGA